MSHASSSRPIAGRFEPQRVLRSGNGVDTVLARDLSGGGEVVVKSVDATVVDGPTQRRFEHEIHVLGALSGLGLPRLIASGRDDGRFYLAASYLPGRPLDQVLSDGPPTVAAALRIGAGIAAALDVLHAAGVCHRDVKPANVIIDADGTAGLVDFGFARSARLDSSVRDDLVGTIRYLAPEAAGLLPLGPDERSDLYSLGVVLFECLTGRPPFRADTVGEVLREHLSSPPPPLRDVHIGRAVEALVHRLLRKDPDERYQSAAALAGDLTELADLAAQGVADPQFVIGRTDRRRGLTDPSFVGRDAELAELVRLADGVAAGRGGIALLEADSGGGKSRLLQELTQHAAGAGVRVLRGQGIALAGQRPFAMFHGVADELAATLSPDEAAQLRTALGASAPSVTRALPALSDVLGVDADENTGPEQFGELRNMAALQQMLAALAAAGPPLLLVLDDCQWADSLTVRLLQDLFAAGAPERLGVVAAFRANEVPRSHPLRRIAGARRVRLGPLPEPAMAELAESMAGPLPPAALDLLVRLADGNPFMGAAVLRGMVEAGALTAGSGWTVDPGRLQDVQAARRSAVFLVRRLEMLSDDALRLLSVGAVLGKQFDPAVALDVAEMADATAILEHGRRNRLLWVDEQSGRWRFFHDKIREALLGRLDEDARRELHRRAADALAARADEDADGYVFELAYHLDAAGRPADALPHALAGAALARQRYALDTAVAHYRMAARAEDPSVQLEIAEGLGEVLTLQGSYAEAREQTQAARRLVTEPARAAALEGKLGDIAIKTGDIGAAKQHLEGALEMLGGSVPRTSGRLLARVLWEALVQVAHTVAPRLLVGRRAGRGRDTDFLAMRLYSRLAYMYWFHSGRIPCAWAHFRGLNLAERFGPSAELGQAYSEHAPVMTTLPWYARGLRYAQRSLEIRRGLGDVWGQGQSLGFTAVVQYAAGHWADAQASAENAIALLERTGDQWEVNTAGWHVALSQWRRGALTEAADTAREVYRAAYAIGDLTAAGIALSIWTRARHGAVDVRLIDDLLARGGEDAQTRAELHLAAGLAARRAGDLPAAAAALQRGIDVVTAAGLRQEYVAPLFPWHATVLREQAEAVAALRPERRRVAARAAAESARRATSWARRYRNNAPHAWRERGLAAALAGHRRRARRWLQRSLDLATAQGAAYEHAATAAALAALDDVGLDEALAALARFDGEPADEPGATLSQSDRFATLLTVGRAITAAHSLGALEVAIRAAAQALLRTDRCHLIPVSAPLDFELTSQSGGQIEGLSRALVAQAVETGAPAVSLDLADETNESLVLAGVRSALAAPITVGDVPTVCLYVTHRDLGQLFGEEEVQLAAFIAALAGAAYEHLAGSETRFRSLVQNSGDVITLVDRDGIVSYQSSAIASEFGFGPAGFVGQPVTRWVHPDDAGLLLAPGAAEGTRVQCRLRDATGAYRTCEVSVVDLLAEPTVAAIVLTTRDVTERTRFEDELVEKNVALERANRAKDMFLASMSHELRTPLNAIMGFTGTLLMRLPGPLNDEQEKQLTTVEQNGTHLLSIINDLLDLARIESGEVQLTLEPVDCAAVVADVARTLEPLARAKQLPLTVELAEAVSLSDARALSQILINLVNNAIKFTDAGSVRVTVADGADGVRISVADTGVGIDDADLERIFTAFARAKNSSRRAREGTGLGLHISQRLAELIGAHITVDSHAGPGTVFTVTLPPSRLPAAVG